MRTLLFTSLFFLLVLVSSQGTNSSNSTGNGTGAGNNTNSNVSITNNTNSGSNGSCNGPFYSAAKFQEWGLERPLYLANASKSTNLTYCKMYNNVASCCDSNTDLAIKAYYDNYKKGMADMTGQRIKDMKTEFDKFKNISVDPSLANVTGLNNSIKNVIDDIKNKFTEVNKEIVSCAIASLKLSVGLLCTGCSANPQENQNNSKLILKKGACMALAQNCFKLVQSMNSTRNTSRDAFMNFTDTITTYIGDTVSTNNSQASSNDTILFGDLSKINLTSNLTSRRLEEGKDGKEMMMENPELVINNTVELFLRAFPGLTKEQFIICKKNATDQKCTTHPMMLKLENQTEAQMVFDAFNNKSKWGFIPVCVALVIKGGNGTQNGGRNGGNRLLANGTGNGTGNLSTNFSNFSAGGNATPNLELHFIFTHQKPNTDMIKFLIAPDIPVQQKIGKIMEIERDIMDEMRKFSLFFNVSKQIGENKNLTDQDDLRRKFDDNKILGCVFKELDDSFRRANKSIFNDACDFNISLNATSNCTICGNSSNDTKMVDRLKGCSGKGDQINNISGTCQNKTCVICVNNLCFTQSLKFEQMNDSAKLDYSKDKGREQFDKDKKVSLKTGKRVPDFIDLPDTSFLTNFNFTPPCNDINQCTQWFCTSFLRGPVAKIEKIYNPQESGDKMDQNTTELYAKGKKNRVLQTTSSSDVIISETGGVDFNQVAESTAFNTSITIDGVSTSSSSYTNTTNNATTQNNTNNGSFGGKGVFNGMLFFAFGLIMVLMI